MKNLLYLITIILALFLQSCEKPLQKKVYGESIYHYKNFVHVLVHKTSDCKAIKSGVTPIDTTRLWWKTDYYTDGVSIVYCSACLNDEEIGTLNEHRVFQYNKKKKEVEAVPPAE